MAEYVIMPKLGFNMDKGKIVQWLKKEGEAVKEREAILQVETDKTVIDVEASIGGILRKVFLGEGNEVPVTLPIGIIAEQSEDVENMIQEAYHKLASIKKGDQGEELQQINENVNRNQKKEIFSQANMERLKISPRARKLVEQFKIDLDELKEYKDEGIINEKDIVEFQEGKKKKLMIETGNRNVVKKITYDGIRKIIGDRLSQSKFTAPHLYFTTSINMQKPLKILEIFNQENDIKITINDLIAYIIARVLEKNNDINVSLVNDQIIFHSQVNLGIAVAIEEGLIVPVVPNADEKSIVELSKEIKNLAQLARQRKLPPEDYEGGTFTISNLGMYDIDHFTAIINPPEAAILAIGSIKRYPVVDIIDDIEQIVIKSIMKVTLSVDHRLIDGVKAVAFLNQIKENIENLKSIK